MKFFSFLFVYSPCWWHINHQHWIKSNKKKTAADNYQQILTSSIQSDYNHISSIYVSICYILGFHHYENIQDWFVKMSKSILLFFFLYLTYQYKSFGINSTSIAIVRLFLSVRDLKPKKSCWQAPCLVYLFHFVP